MKKTILFLVLFLGVGLVSAQVSESLDYLDESKDILVESLQDARVNLLDEKDDLEDRLAEYRDYEVLVSLGKLDESDLDKVLEWYKEIDDGIIEDYIDLESNINTLNRRRELGRLTGDAFDQSLSWYRLDIDDYVEDYNSKLSGFVADGQEVLTKYESNYQYYADSLSGDLANIYSNIDYLEKVFDKYYELYAKVDDVDRYYLGRSGDITSFLKEAKEITETDLKEMLQDRYDRRLDRVDHLDYYEGRIESKIDSIMVVYSRDISDEFDGVLDEFYDPEVYSTVKDDIDEFKSLYLSGDTYNYSLLSGESLTGVNETIESIDDMKDQISARFEDFDDAKEQDDIQWVLQEKVVEFYDDQRYEFRDRLDEYLDEREKLLDSKLREELREYNSLMGKYSSLSSDEVDAILDLQEEIQAFKDGVIVDHRVENLEEKYWELEVKLIDNRISEEYSMYFGVYSNLGAQLDSIIGSIRDSYIEQDQAEEFEASAQRALDNIDEALDAWEISEMHEYLFLEIKKHFIKYLHIK